jgi:hypothetical protein
MLTAVLCACTGVPSNSPPQVVQNQVGGQGQTAAVSFAPPANADPRTIVADFLAALAADDPHHTAARNFLSPAARARWSDTSATILNSFKISTFQNGVVTVTGQQIGSLNASGAYAPVLQGSGDGGQAVPFSFTLKQVAGQWRIDNLQNGVLLSAANFQRFYTQRELYFYDLDEQRLVPDPRFTNFPDPPSLANWLVGQLVAGPTPALQNGVTTQFPAQTDPHRVSVAIGPTTEIDLPGAAGLDAATRFLLAAQLAATLNQVPTIGEMRIVDTGHPVPILRDGSTQFAAGDFPLISSTPVTSPSVYYVRAGGVVDLTGKPLPGPVGNGTYAITSVALATSGTNDLRVAAVSGSGPTARLLIGTVGQGLRATAVRGPLSRPAWVPGRDEVWIGDGATLRRCTPTACTGAVSVTATSGSPRGSVVALRFSPEGARVAVVFAAPDGTAQVWVGTVVRSQTQVRVDGLQAITPTGIAITDVAWNDPLKLFVIGRPVSSPSSPTARAVPIGDADIYEVQVDGSLWTPRTVANLPQDPDSITVAENEDAWVSAGSTVWVQRAGGWASPGPGSTPGTNPVYVE